MLSISPGNSPQFQAVLQPVNAGPVVASQVVWSVGSYTNATVTQVSTDLTGLSATLDIGTAAAAGDQIPLTVTITNQDGSVVTVTDNLTVTSTTPLPPTYVNVTGAVINQVV